MSVIIVCSAAAVNHCVAATGLAGVGILPVLPAGSAHGRPRSTAVAWPPIRRPCPGPARRSPWRRDALDERWSDLYYM